MYNIKPHVKAFLIDYLLYWVLLIRFYLNCQNKNIVKTILV